MEKTEPVPLADRSARDNVSSIKEHVPKTYQGTAADRHEMSMLGKKQVLRRQFKFMTMLGFASTVSKHEHPYALLGRENQADFLSRFQKWWLGNLFFWCPLLDW